MFLDRWVLCFHVFCVFQFPAFLLRIWGQQWVRTKSDYKSGVLESLLDNTAFTAQTKTIIGSLQRSQKQVENKGLVNHAFLIGLIAKMRENNKWRKVQRWGKVKGMGNRCVCVFQQLQKGCWCCPLKTHMKDRWAMRCTCTHTQICICSHIYNLDFSRDNLISSAKNIASLITF